MSKGIDVMTTIEEDDCDFTHESDQESHREENFGCLLNGVLSEYFEYKSGDTSLNIADILLLNKQSIDTQNELLSNQNNILNELITTIRDVMKK